MESAQNLLPIETVSLLAPKLPYSLLTDINQRMMDWKATGGEDADPYMYQQSRVAENYYRFVLKLDPKEFEQIQ
ncbi:DUF6877 family protein [Levilactobacillus brevis]|uniref:DUF6877 family protein n=1 Tax=Levilactobacillus brevis TaxID=1580 RepID=UPI001C02F2DF|nr:DUF6877 family protein [Levilactobacillus brevis]